MNRKRNFEFLEMFNQLKIKAEISIIGKINSISLQNRFESVIKKNSNILFPVIFLIENH